MANNEQNLLAYCLRTLFGTEYGHVDPHSQKGEYIRKAREYLRKLILRIDGIEEVLMALPNFMHSSGHAEHTEENDCLYKAYAYMMIVGE